MKNLESMALRVRDGVLTILDQTMLPHEERWIVVRHPDEMVVLIQKLSVRGAPLIGVAAAISFAHFAEQGADEPELKMAFHKLRSARPTAVNLMNAMDRMLNDGDCLPSAVELVRRAELLFNEDVALCEAMANRGAALIQDGDRILTHCNSGGLATVGVGTALGVIRRAYEQGKRIHVYVDETRPLLQGARLTAWELSKLKIPYTLICDNMAGFLMSQNKITRAFVGCDRVARNGDFANKIGTYAAAVLARHHGVPFYVVGPKTTLDENCATGADIPIEERDPLEVRAGLSPADAPVYNPAFDVTPRSLISGIVLDDRMM